MALSPSVATMMALMVCSRFSAWSKTMFTLGFEDILGDFQRAQAVFLEYFLAEFCSSILCSAGRQCMNFTGGFWSSAMSCAFTW